MIDNHLEILLQHLTVPGPLGPVTQHGPGTRPKLLPRPHLRPGGVRGRLGGQGREDDAGLPVGDRDLVVQVLNRADIYKYFRSKIQDINCQRCGRLSSYFKC